MLQPQFCKDLTRKNSFLRSGLGSSQYFGTGTRHSLEDLHQCGKMVKNKTQKILGLIPPFVEATWEILVGGPFCPPPTPSSWIGLRKVSANSFFHDIFCMIFQENFSSCYILLTDQVLLFDCLYFWRYWAICVLQSFSSQLWLNEFSN